MRRTGTGSRPGGRSARVRENVLGAVLDVLQRVGFDGLTIAEVARSAGVHETSIYRRWQTREALVLDAILSSGEGAVPVPDTGTVAGDLVALLDALVRRLRTPLGSTMLMLAVRGVADTPGAGLRDAYWSAQLDRVRPLLDRAVERGELGAEVPARHLLEMVLGPVYLRTLVTGDRIDRSFLADVVDTALAGVGCDAGPQNSWENRPRA